MAHLRRQIDTKRTPSSESSSTYGTNTSAFFRLGHDADEMKYSFSDVTSETTGLVESLTRSHDEETSFGCAKQSTPKQSTPREEVRLNTPSNVETIFRSRTKSVVCLEEGRKISEANPVESSSSGTTNKSNVAATNDDKSQCTETNSILNESETSEGSRSRKSIGVGSPKRDVVISTGSAVAINPRIESVFRGLEEGLTLNTTSLTKSGSRASDMGSIDSLKKHAIASKSPESINSSKEPRMESTHGIEGTASTVSRTSTKSGQSIGRSIRSIVKAKAKNREPKSVLPTKVGNNEVHVVNSSKAKTKAAKDSNQKVEYHNDPNLQQKFDHIMKKSEEMFTSIPDPPSGDPFQLSFDRLRITASYDSKPTMEHQSINRSNLSKSSNGESNRIESVPEDNRSNQFGELVSSLQELLMNFSCSDVDTPSFFSLCKTEVKSGIKATNKLTISAYNGAKDQIFNDDQNKIFEKWTKGMGFEVSELYKLVKQSIESSACSNPSIGSLDLMRTISDDQTKSNLNESDYQSTTLFMTEVDEYAKLLDITRSEFLYRVAATIADDQTLYDMFPLTCLSRDSLERKIKRTNCNLPQNGRFCLVQDTSGDSAQPYKSPKRLTSLRDAGALMSEDAGAFTIEDAPVIKFSSDETMFEENSILTGDCKSILSSIHDSVSVPETNNKCNINSVVSANESTSVVSTPVEDPQAPGELHLRVGLGKQAFTNKEKKKVSPRKKFVKKGRYRLFA